jgi:hypothetical protein
VLRVRRRGRYSVEMLISEHRTDAKLTDLLVTLANGRRRVGSRSTTAVAPAMSDITGGEPRGPHRRPEARGAFGHSTGSESRLRASLRLALARQPQDDFAIALAGPAHGPHAIDDRPLDLNEALAPIALHGPPCCARGQVEAMAS